MGNFIHVGTGKSIGLLANPVLFVAVCHLHYEIIRSQKWNDLLFDKEDNDDKVSTIESH